MKIIEAYGDFLKKEFDPSVVEGILGLNNSPEFKSYGISISLYDGVKKVGSPKNLYDLTFLLSDINQRIKDLGKSKIIKIFTIGYKYNYYECTGCVVLGQVKSGNDYKYVKRAYSGIANIGVTYLDDFPNASDSEDIFDKDEISNNIKSHIVSQYLRRKNSDEINKSDMEIKNRKYKSDSEYFLKKFDNQFFEDEFANVFDLCKTHSISKISFVTDVMISIIFDCNPMSVDTNTQTYSVRQYIGKLDNTMSDILSELMECSSRMEEYGFGLYYKHTDDGIGIILKYNKT